MVIFSPKDSLFMQQALRLAAQATRRAAPNPGVGCVLVRDDEVIGQGATLKVGGDHAEIQAIKDCLSKGNTPRGATAYVTLEPCSHYGRTPPCAKRLVEEGLARVVVAMQDPYHEVSGRGVAILRDAGITTEVGLLEDEARRIHRGFLSRVERQRPWVTLKAAASLDGKTALLNGNSQWITSADARHDVQRMRARSCAILTGSGTVMADNPRLTVRKMDVPEQPWRVVVDSKLKCSPESQIFWGGKTLLLTTVTDKEKYLPYEVQGTEVLRVDSLDGHVDLVGAMNVLALRGVNELMIEAGAGLNGALLQAGVVDEIVLYMAPCLIGDAAQGVFSWPALQQLSEKVMLKIMDARMVGVDLRLTLRPTSS